MPRHESSLLILLILLSRLYRASLPPPPRRCRRPMPSRSRSWLPVQTIEPEPEVTPPLTRATLPVPPPPRSEMGFDDNPYAGRPGRPRPGRRSGFPVPSMAIPKR